MKTNDLPVNKIAYLDTACMGLIDPDVAAEAKNVISSLENISSSPTEFTVYLYDNSAGRGKRRPFS